MRVASLEHETDFDGWRRAARAFRLAGVRPGEAAFRVGAVETGLFDEVATTKPNELVIGVTST